MHTLPPITPSTGTCTSYYKLYINYFNSLIQTLYHMLQNKGTVEADCTNMVNSHLSSLETHFVPTGDRTMPLNRLWSRSVSTKPSRTSLRPEHLRGSHCSRSHMASGTGRREQTSPPTSASSAKHQIISVLSLPVSRWTVL